MDESTTPIRDHGVLPPLAETQPGHPIARAIQTSDSDARAKQLAALQAGRRKEGESHYEIRYYMHADAAHSLQGTEYGIFEAVTRGNPVRPVNATMRAAIESSFATLQEQLPGRFVFTRVDHALDADITFAGIDELYTYQRDGKGNLELDPYGRPQPVHASGATAKDSGTILLDLNDFSDKCTADIRIMALHEIAHALGLDHPHDYQKPENSTHITGASFYDTIMSYPSENRASAFPLTTMRSAPVTLMPADMAALIALYPLPGDTSAMPAIAALPDVAGHVMVALTDDKGNSRAIPFPRQGMAYVPAQDTAADRLNIGGTMPSVKKEEHLQNENGWSATRHATIRMLPNGVEIYQPNDRAAVLLPVKPETLVLASDIALTASIEGNTHVIIPTSRYDTIVEGQINCSVTVSGTGNRISMPATELAPEALTGINIRPGAQVEILITDADALQKHPEYGLSGTLRPDLLREEIDAATATIRWKKESDNRYQVTVAPLDAGRFAPMEITIVLDSHAPKAHAALQWMLNQPLMVEGLPLSEKYEGQEGVREDSGIRYIMPRHVQADQENVHAAAETTAPRLSKSLPVQQAVPTR